MYGLNAKDRGKQVPMDWSREPYEPSSFGFALEGSMTSEPKRVLHGAGAEQQSDPVCDMDKSENDNTNENRSEDSNSNSKSKSKGLELAVALTSCSSPLRQEPGSSSVIAKRPFFRAKTPTSALSMEPSASHRQDPRQRLYLPYILIGYLQLIWNVILVVLFLYCMYAVYMVLSEELSVRMASSLHSMVSEARQCRHLYESNRCAPLQRVPALEKDCSAWEYCMNRDGESEYGAFGKCKLIAETVADTMNAFVEKISYKTMIFLILLALLLVFVSNALFTLMRARLSLSAAKPKRMPLVKAPRPTLYPPPLMSYGQPFQVVHYEDERVNE